MPVHVQALSYGCCHSAGRSLKLSDLKRAPIKTEIIRDGLFQYRFVAGTGNSCYMYLCLVVKKNRGGGIEGFQFRI